MAVGAQAVADGPVADGPVVARVVSKAVDHAEFARVRPGSASAAARNARSDPRDPIGAVLVRMTLLARARAGAGPADSALVEAAQPAAAQAEAGRSDLGAAPAPKVRDDPPPAHRRDRPASSLGLISRRIVRSARTTVPASSALDRRVAARGRAARRGPSQRVHPDPARRSHAGSSHGASSLAIQARSATQTSRHFRRLTARQPPPTWRRARS